MTEQEQTTDSLFDDGENESESNDLNQYEKEFEFDFDMGQDMIPTEEDFAQALGEI